jgi:hypothetical protein
VRRRICCPTVTPLSVLGAFARYCLNSSASSNVETPSTSSVACPDSATKTLAPTATARKPKTATVAIQNTRFLFSMYTVREAIPIYLT